MKTNKSPGRRYIGRHGFDVTLKHYEWGSENEQGDPTRSERTNSPFTVQAIRSSSREATRTIRQSGEDLEVEKFYYIREDAQDSNGNSATANLTGSGETDPASELVDDGTTYQVLEAENTRSGVYVVQVARQ